MLITAADGATYEATDEISLDAYAFRFANANAFKNLYDKLFFKLLNQGGDVIVIIPWKEAEENMLIRPFGNNTWFIDRTSATQQWPLAAYYSFCTNADGDATIYNTYDWGLQRFALANIDDMRLRLLSWHELGQSL